VRNLHLAVLLLLGVMLVAAGCSEGSEEETPVEDITRGPDVRIVIPPDTPIVIGVSSALTGPIGPRGTEYRDAVVASVNRWKIANGDTIGEHGVEIVAADDGCSEVGVAEVSADLLLRQPGLVGVVGPQCSGGAAATIPLYAAAGIVAISGSATRTDLTTTQAADGFFFRTAFRNDLEGALIGLFFTGDAIMIDRAYFIDIADDPFSVDLANAAADVVDREGGVELIRESVVPGTVDYGETVDRVLAADVDFVGFSGFNPEAALLYRQLRDAGFTGGFGAGDAAASQENFIDPLGEVSEGALFSGCQYPLPADFVTDYESVHGSPPSETFPGQYADAVSVLLDAVSAVAQVQDDGSLVIEPAELRDAIRATSFEGLTGPISFDENGDRVPEPGQSLSEMQDAAFETQDPDIYTNVGLIPCQVQNGDLVPLGGPTAGELCCLGDLLPPDANREGDDSSG
jgi:branched-chain amino acid transport system substrate-binding protein